jgi:DNA processing protein
MSVELIALSLIPGLGDHNVKLLVSYCGSAEAVFRTTKKKLQSIPGIGPKIIKSIQDHEGFSDAEEILRKSAKEGCTFLTYLDKEYPNRLKLVMDAPVYLYKKGNGTLNNGRMLAIVGTRKATHYGKETTRKIVEGLQGSGTTIVSGLAYGIDIEAHRAALDCDLPTIGVLAGGLNKIYPGTHKKYAQEMCELGAIVTESAPDTIPEPHLFPARNRIIAGMSDAVIVVEAAEKGGALITAQIADSYDRTVFAVPGNLQNEYSKGTNKLISSQKAIIYTGIEDLIYQLGWDLEQAPAQNTIPELSGDEEKIYALLRTEQKPIEIDLIAVKCQLPVNQVASHLLSLEFQNLVKSLPGKKFTLK